MGNHSLFLFTKVRDCFILLIFYGKKFFMVLAILSVE